MSKLVRVIKSNRGEGYIDVVISVSLMMVMVLALNVFLLTVKQDMGISQRDEPQHHTENNR